MQRFCWIVLLLFTCPRPAGASDHAVLGPPHLLPTPAPAPSGQPFLAVSPEGRVWMSWIERASGGRRLLVAPLGERSRAARTIASGESLVANGADTPCLAALGGGRLAAAWGVKRGEGEALALRVALSSDAGATWTPAVTPHADHSATEHGFAHLVAEGEGARVVWLDGRAGVGREEGEFDMALRTAHLDAHGVVVDERELDGRTCDCCPTALVATATGPLVAYRDRSETEVRDIAVLRIGSAPAARPERVHADDWTIAGCPVNGPALSSDGRRVAIAWFTGAGDTARVEAAFSNDDGRTFGVPVRVDEGTPVGRVDVALLGDGSAAVAWLESHGERVRLRARRVTAGTSPGLPVTVATLPTLRGVGMPRMVRAGRRLVFAWTEPGPAPRVKLAEIALR
jgi:hypothetical protein